MKTLLLLILCPTLCFGQIHNWDSIAKQADISAITYAIGDGIEKDGIFYVDYNPSITLNDLIDYKNECYNDSTKYCYRKICDWDCEEIKCDCNAKPQYITLFNEKGEKEQRELFPCSTKYIHRTPTFEGFIKWVEKKYKLNTK